MAISICISLKFASENLPDNKSALYLVMGCRRTGAKPLSRVMIIQAVYGDRHRREQMS